MINEPFYATPRYLDVNGCEIKNNNNKKRIEKIKTDLVGQRLTNYISPSPRGGYGVFSPDQVLPVFFDSWDPKRAKKNWGAIPER